MRSVEGEESPCRILASIAIVSPWRTTFGASRPDMEIATKRRRRSTAVGGAQSVEDKMNVEHPTGFWWCSLTQTKMKRQFSGHAVPQRLCENLINVLKLLANLQIDGDSPIQNIVTGLREKGKERSLRSFIASDNCCGVKVGHLRRASGPSRS